MAPYMGQHCFPKHFALPRHSSITIVGLLEAVLMSLIFIIVGRGHAGALHQPLPLVFLREYDLHIPVGPGHAGALHPPLPQSVRLIPRELGRAAVLGPRAPSQKIQIVGERHPHITKHPTNI